MYNFYCFCFEWYSNHNFVFIYAKTWGQGFNQNNKKYRKNRFQQKEIVTLSKETIAVGFFSKHSWHVLSFKSGERLIAFPLCFTGDKFIKSFSGPLPTHVAVVQRSGHQRWPMKKGVIRNFTGKYMCQSLFVDKVAGLRPRALLQRYFPVNLSKFLRTPFHRTPPDDCFCLEQTRQLVCRVN